MNYLLTSSFIGSDTLIRDSQSAPSSRPTETPSTLADETTEGAWEEHLC